jgi:hypothetical protein
MPDGRPPQAYARISSPSVYAAPCSSTPGLSFGSHRTILLFFGWPYHALYGLLRGHRCAASFHPWTSGIAARDRERSPVLGQAPAEDRTSARGLRCALGYQCAWVLFCCWEGGTAVNGSAFKYIEGLDGTPFVNVAKLPRWGGRGEIAGLGSGLIPEVRCVWWE